MPGTRWRASGPPATGFKRLKVSNSGVTEQCAILLAEAYAHRLQLLYGMWLVDRVAYFVYTPAGLQASAVGAVRSAEIERTTTLGTRAAAAEYMAFIDSICVWKKML